MNANTKAEHSKAAQKEISGKIIPEKQALLQILRCVWSREEGQDIAEYAVMLAVILVVVIGTVRLIGGNTQNVFSTVGNNLQ
jgi:Flp pilus assembly pilin Flp